ncbi:hypothetical protein [Polynucleobacter sp. P1-05-14]|uniref:hypothetical protein n=1 Tax=Polynucleobacter sp. P1-05-14 TaxID=1819732 RepID=UPI001C0C4505|nr:hypothetical protein [Polynucleobacter sp. P1-05-14]MBU3548099.1 hypothetical protein [Polynucleobacter sp. P1-05-14]
MQDEHNEARDRFNQHRDLCIPGWVASADINEKTIKKHSDSRFGEITIVDSSRCLGAAAGVEVTMVCGRV